MSSNAGEIYVNGVDANSQWGFHRSVATSPEDAMAITGGNLGYAVPPVGTGLVETISEHKSWNVQCDASGSFCVRLAPWLNQPIDVLVGQVGPALAPAQLDVVDSALKNNMKYWMQLGICARFEPTQDMLQRSGSIAAIGQYFGTDSSITFDVIADNDGGVVVQANEGVHVVRAHMPVCTYIPVYNGQASNLPFQYRFDPHEFVSHDLFQQNLENGGANFLFTYWDSNTASTATLAVENNELVNTAVIYGQGLATGVQTVGRLTVTAVYAFINKGTGVSTRPIEVYRPASTPGPQAAMQTAQAVAATAGRIGDLFGQENMSKLKDFASGAMKVVGAGATIAGYLGVPGAGVLGDIAGLFS